jgi:hypothetical protein
MLRPKQQLLLSLAIIPKQQEETFNRSTEQEGTQPSSCRHDAESVSGVIGKEKIVCAAKEEMFMRTKEIFLYLIRTIHVSGKNIHI